MTTPTTTTRRAPRSPAHARRLGAIRWAATWLVIILAVIVGIGVAAYILANGLTALTAPEAHYKIKGELYSHSAE